MPSREIVGEAGAAGDVENERRENGERQRGQDLDQLPTELSTQGREGQIEGVISSGFLRKREGSGVCLRPAGCSAD